MMEPREVAPTSWIGYNRCSAPTCKNDARNNYNLSFFRFPKDFRRCNIWINNSKLCNKAGNTAEYCYKHYRLCSEHFEDHMFASMLKNRLKKIAIPTLFKPVTENVSSFAANFGQQLDCEENYAVEEHNIKTTGENMPEDAVENIFTEIGPDLSEEEYLLDMPEQQEIAVDPLAQPEEFEQLSPKNEEISSDGTDQDLTEPSSPRRDTIMVDLSSPRQAKRHLDRAYERIAQQNRKIRTLQQSKRRLQRKIKSLEDFINHLQNQINASENPG